MAATALAAITVPIIPIGEYLGSVYRPDVDYVEGVLEERNLGEFDHAELQWALLNALTPIREQGYRATPELRVQIAPDRFRVPDICVLGPAWKKTQVVQEAPVLCIEVLSPRDTVMQMRHRCGDYLRMGVGEVWIFDPVSRTAYVLTSGTMTEHRSGTLQIGNSPICLDVSSIFAVLD